MISAMKLLALAAIHLLATPSAVLPGHVVRIHTSASPCHPGGQVTLISKAFPGHAFGIGTVYGTAHANGAFSVSVRVLRNLKPGSYHASIRCGGGNLPSLAYFRVR